MTVSKTKKTKRKVTKKKTGDDLVCRSRRATGDPVLPTDQKAKDAHMLSVDDVCAILVKCKQSSVLSFSWAGLSVSFKETSDIPTVTVRDDLFGPDENISRVLRNEVPGVPGIQSSAEVDEYDQERLEELCISDPVAFEEALANGDLEHGVSES